MRRLGIVAVGLALAFGALSCQEQGAVPERTATAFPTAIPDWSEASSECTDLAKQATEAKFGTEEYAGRTDDFTGFAETVMEAGDPYGVPQGLLSLSVWFEGYYQSLFGRSPMQHPEAWQFYETHQEECMREKGLAPEDDPLDWGKLTTPSSEEQAIIECVAGLIIEVQREYGEGSIGYTTAYRNFAENRPAGEDAGVDLLAHEKLYQEITGRSPFVNADAMASFRAKAKDCPQQ